MPTPFMHLDYAERMKRHLKMSAALWAKIEPCWPAFYLGSIAPDFQAICDVPRELTHFYPVPLLPHHSPVGFERLLAENRALTDTKTISPDHAVFLAAYGAHLLWDLVWYNEVVMALFVMSPHFKEGSKREWFMVHNILLTHLDRKSKSVLPTDGVVSAETILQTAHISNLAPFIHDDHLAEFQRQIVTQLAPDAPSQTVAVYAGRMGMTPSEFNTYLDDADWMQEKLFQRVSVEKVETLLDETVSPAIDLLVNYLLT